MMTGRNGGDGRDERFRSLYQQYFRRVVRYLVRAFHVTEEDAEELAQDAFLRFYEAMEEYRGDAQWAFFETIARNVALNRIRSKQTHKRNATLIALDDPEKAIEPTAPTVPDYADRQFEELRRKQVHEAICTLPDGQRQCMQLWIADRSYEEIARTLKITIDAVKSRLRDAKKLLRARLGDAELPEDER
jgi:RNA polymerase sigma-70 factor (ECF subfamily)